jgi:hypothetical protein
MKMYACKFLDCCAGPNSVVLCVRGVTVFVFVLYPKTSETGPVIVDFLLSLLAYPGILFGGRGVQQIQLRTEDRENGDLGTVAL